MKRTKILGMKELEKTIKEIEKLPQKCVTKAAKSGARIVLREAKANAPFLTGALKKGIILYGERVRLTGKKVYQVVFDRNMNDIFAKTHKLGVFNSRVRNLTKRARKLKLGDYVRSYYPASMEYGYFSRDGNFIPGYHFLRNAIDKNSRQIETKIVGVLSKEIDKLR